MFRPFFQEPSRSDEKQPDIPRCYYALLEIKKDATTSEIRQAYRKQALLWHPDKNPDRITEATRRFTALQRAYEVLSDDRERKWYDDNRDSLLKHAGQMPASGLDSEEEDDDTKDREWVELKVYAQTSAFVGFGIGQQGFYGLYSALFNWIDECDRQACARRRRHRQQHQDSDDSNDDSDLDDNDVNPPRPSFGGPDLSIDAVKAFYDAWRSYVVPKARTWHGTAQYDTRTAPNRRIRRAMMKENQRAETLQRRQWQDQVRQVVDFVKSRDPRYVQWQKEQAAAAKVQSTQNAQQRAQERREERAALAAAYVAPEWTKIDHVQETGFTWTDEDSADNDEVNVEFCVACNKSFKSEAQWKNHAQSKKHKQAVAVVRRAMQKEERLAAKLREQEVEVVEKVGFQQENVFVPAKENENADDRANREIDALLAQMDALHVPVKGEWSEKDSTSGDELIQVKPLNKSAMRRQKRAAEWQSRQRPAAHFSDDEDANENQEQQQEDVSEHDSDSPSVQRKPRRRKEKSKALSSSAHQCNVCKSGFPSRNALFQHLSSTGHARK